MGDEWPRTFVFLLKFNTTNLKEIPDKIGHDRAQWKGDCKFVIVTGDYDAVAIADNGTTEEALVYASYLTGTKRYTVCSTLMAFQENEFRYATGTGEDPHRKI